MNQKEWVEFGFLWWRGLNAIAAELLSWPRIVDEHVKETYGVTPLVSVLYYPHDMARQTSRIRRSIDATTSEAAK